MNFKNQLVISNDVLLAAAHSLKSMEERGYQNCVVELGQPLEIDGLSVVQSWSIYVGEVAAAKVLNNKPWDGLQEPKKIWLKKDLCLAKSEECIG